MMQPYKKAKLDNGASTSATADMSASDPFDAEDDWDNDDEILALVESEVPTYSQMSQAIRAPAVGKPGSTPSVSAAQNHGVGKRTGFMFKTPSAMTSKPASYINSNHSVLEREVSKPPHSQWEIGQGAVSQTNGSQSGVRHSNSSLSGVGHCISSQSGVGHSNGSQSGVGHSNDVTLLKKQVSDLVRKQHAHEGEIKWLRSTLQDKDKQTAKIRSNMSEESAKLKLQNSEKERGFSREIENLRSELQFKESEVMNVTQELDKLKRQQAACKPAPIALGADGFPNSSDVLGTSPKKSRNVITTKSSVKVPGPKTEKMDIDSKASSSSETSQDSSKCDLKPAPEYRLKPRTLTMSKFKQKLLVTNMLRCSLSSVQDKIETTPDVTDKDKCLEILSQSLACAKDLCHI